MSTLVVFYSSGKEQDETPPECWCVRSGADCQLGPYSQHPPRQKIQHQLGCWREWTTKPESERSTFPSRHPFSHVQGQEIASSWQRVIGVLIHFFYQDDILFSIIVELIVLLYESHLVYLHSVIRKSSQMNALLFLYNARLSQKGVYISSRKNESFWDM